MDHFTLALMTGAVAGALDIIPMIAQNSRSAPACRPSSNIFCRTDRLLQQPALPALVGGRYGRDSHDGSAGRTDPHGQRP